MDLTICHFVNKYTGKPSYIALDGGSIGAFNTYMEITTLEDAVNNLHFDIDPPVLFGNGRFMLLRFKYKSANKANTAVTGDLSITITDSNTTATSNLSVQVIYTDDIGTIAPGVKNA